MPIEPKQMEVLQKQLVRNLFENPHLHAYAVLDGASNPALLDHLYDDEPPEFACLYRGKLEPDMAECAPYLVRLEADAPFTQWITGAGWGQHWGIFAVADCDLRSLRYHLRKLNMIYSAELHKPLLFRYYDPRVINVFLPGCEPKQVAKFFGPVQAWFAESDGGACLMRLVRDEQQQVIADKV